MEIVLLLLKQSLIMFVYLLIGYFLYKRKLVSKQGSADMGRMLLYVIMPVAILKSYIRDFSAELLEGLAVSFVLALLSLILAVVVSRLLFKKEEGVERFGAAFSNAGFIGIPLVQMALGTEAVFYVASFVAILNILQWTYGVLVMTGDRSVIRPRKICTNPIVISFLAGLLLFFAPVTLPEMLTDIISTLSSMNGPIAMIVLGVYLGQVPLKSLFTDRLVYKCAAVRLLLIPALTIVLMLIVPAKYPTIKLTVLIAAAAPVGSNVAIFAQLYDQDYTRAVKEVCLSTLLCIVTLPVVVGVANMLF
ncbi:MAG: AEC family transporter [Lachnospiraceae bacterium]|nr:AEC family transporter [Lachnospiraceae bacterium]